MSGKFWKLQATIVCLAINKSQLIIIITTGKRGAWYKLEHYPLCPKTLKWERTQTYESKRDRWRWHHFEKIKVEWNFRMWLHHIFPFRFHFLKKKPWILFNHITSFFGFCPIFVEISEYVHMARRSCGEEGGIKQERISSGYPSDNKCSNIRFQN